MVRDNLLKTAVADAPATLPSSALSGVTGTKDSHQWTSLKECFVWRHLGAGSRDDKVAVLEDELNRAILENDPRLIVVTAPYPRGIAPTSRQAGTGLGKTALLEAFVARALARTECDVHFFPKVRERATGGQRFVEQELAPEFIDRRRSAASSVQFYLKSALLRVDPLAHSLWRLVVILALIWLAIAGNIATLLPGFLFPTAQRAGQFINSTPWMPWLVGAALLGLMIAYFSLDRKRRPDLQERWDSKSPDSLRQKARRERCAHLTSQPADMLPLLDYDACTVLVIDDVDSMDNDSVQKLLQLFREASSSQYRLCLVLSFNPQNPDLQELERREILETLLPNPANTLQEQEDRIFVTLNDLDRERVVEVLWDYYGTSAAEEILRRIETQWHDVADQPSRLLGFFLWLDTELGDPRTDLRGVSTEPERWFERYVQRHKDKVEQIVNAIEEKDPTGESRECLECLKYILAFHSHEVPGDVLRKLLKDSGLRNLNTYETVLRDPAVRLLHIDHKGPGSYSLTDPYMRHLLLNAWDQWKDREKYFTRAFDALCAAARLHSIDRWNPEQALARATSREAVEVLYAQGLHFYAYLGQSDAGQALHYLGDDRGAIGKWLELCSSSSLDQLWEHICWKRKTGLRAARYAGSKSPDPWFIGPELVVIAARAYWQIGEVDAAMHLLREAWPTIRDRLPSFNPPSEWPKQMRDRYRRAVNQIVLLVPEILVRHGGHQRWEDALSQCRADDGNAEAALSRFIRANIAHYRRFSVGEMLDPLKFKPNSTITERLLAIGDDEVADPLVRLRALHSVSSADFQIWGLGRRGFNPRTALFKDGQPSPTPSSPGYDSWGRVWGGFDPRSVLFKDGGPTDIEGLALDEAEREQLRASRQKIDRAYDVLKSIQFERPQDAPPGQRMLEIETLLWKGVYLYRGLLLLAVDLASRAHQYKERLERGRLKAILDSCDELAKMCQQFKESSALPFVASGVESESSVASENRSLERIRQYRDWVHQQQFWAEDQQTRPRSREVGAEARKGLQELYQNIVDETVQEADEYLRAAGASYSRFGHRPGRAEVLYHRAMLRLLSACDLPGPTWLQLLYESSQATDDLGFHLERLYALIVVGDILDTSDLFVADWAYQAAIELASLLTPGMPSLLVGELHFRRGSTLRSFIESADSYVRALREMEEARKAYEPNLRGTNFVSQRDVLERCLFIRWNLAELLRRRARDRGCDAVERTELLNQVEEHCNWIIRRCKGDSSLESHEMTARTMKAKVSALREEFAVAVDELRIAADYFSRQDNDFELLQTLTNLCQSIRRCDGPSRDELPSRVHETERVAVRYRQRFGSNANSLSAQVKVALYQACLLLGELYKDDDLARGWLFCAFDTLVSLGFPGRAMQLDDLIGSKLTSEESREAYRERLVRASSHIKVSHETADWALVGTILRRHFGVSLVKSAHLSQKQEYLRMARAMLDLATQPAAGEILPPEQSATTAPDLEQNARAALETGRDVIDNEEPEEVDFELLDELRNLYRRRGEHERALEIEQQLQRLRDTARSRDYYLLAEKYRESGWDVEWALEVATSKDVTYTGSRYYHMASKWLKDLERAGQTRAT